MILVMWIKTASLIESDLDSKAMILNSIEEDNLGSVASAGSNKNQMRYTTIGFYNAGHQIN